jgi:hypothetical protein
MYFIIFLLINVALSQTCFGVPISNSSICSGKGLCVTIDTCSCYSGFSGLNCEVSAPSFCNWKVNSQTMTNYYPLLDINSLSFQNNILKFDIVTPLVIDRLQSFIYIQYTNNSDCLFPGIFSYNTLDTTLPCSNRFSYALPWDKGIKCGWNQKKLNDITIYYGNIFVSQLENIGYIRGYPIQRTILRVIPIMISFHTSVVISTNIKVVAPIKLNALVYKQEYNSAISPIGVIEFYTTLQYPYMIDTSSPYTILSPAGITSSIMDISQDKCNENEECVQIFRIQLNIQETCLFTGNYIASFNIKCNPLFSYTCPISQSNKAQVTISANSENFCASAYIDIQLSSGLQSYRDENFLYPRSTYLIGDLTYFKATINSQITKIITLTIIRVECQNTIKSTVLYDYGKTNDGIANKFELGPYSGTMATFQFQVSNSMMGDVLGYDGGLNVTALIQVKYLGVDGMTTSSVIKNVNSIKQTGSNQISKIGSQLIVTKINCSSSNNFISFFFLFLIIFIV